jgi:hypothetical protein
LDDGDLSFWAVGFRPSAIASINWFLVILAMKDSLAMTDDELQRVIETHELVERRRLGPLLIGTPGSQPQAAGDAQGASRDAFM